MLSLGVFFVFGFKVWGGKAIIFHYAQSISRIRLFATPWTIACQAPLPMGFSRHKYWSGCHFLLQDFPLMGASNLPSRQEWAIALSALSQFLTLPHSPSFPFSHLSGQDCEDAPQHFLCEIRARKGRNMRFVPRYPSLGAFQVCDLPYMTSLSLSFCSVRLGSGWCLRGLALSEVMEAEWPALRGLSINILLC